MAGKDWWPNVSAMFSHRHVLGTRGGTSELVDPPGNVPPNSLIRCDTESRVANGSESGVLPGNLLGNGSLDSGNAGAWETVGLVEG